MGLMDAGQLGQRSTRQVGGWWEAGGSFWMPQNSNQGSMVCSRTGTEGMKQDGYRWRPVIRDQHASAFMRVPAHAATHMRSRAQGMHPGCVVMCQSTAVLMTVSFSPTLRHPLGCWDAALPCTDALTHTLPHIQRMETLEPCSEQGPPALAGVQNHESTGTQTQAALRLLSAMFWLRQLSCLDQAPAPGYV